MVVRLSVEANDLNLMSLFFMDRNGRLAGRTARICLQFLLELSDDVRLLINLVRHHDPLAPLASLLK